MTLPFERHRASLEFERFMNDARDLAGLSTTNMAWNMVVGVLHTFRKRPSVEQALRFADVLPPVLRAIFVEDWRPSVSVVDYGTEEELLAEVRSARHEHNFLPSNAVAAALRRHVNTAALERALSNLPPAAKQRWSVPQT